MPGPKAWSRRVPPGGMTGAGFQARAEAADNGLVSSNPAVLMVGGGPCQLTEYALVIAEYQNMAFAAVLEMEVHAFLFAQALYEMQIGFLVLHAILTRQVARIELKLMRAFENTVVLEHQADDLRNGQGLKNALIGAVCQIAEMGSQRDAVMRQPSARVTLPDLIDLPVDA